MLAICRQPPQAADLPQRGNELHIAGTVLQRARSSRPTERRAIFAEEAAHAKARSREFQTFIDAAMGVERERANDSVLATVKDEGTTWSALGASTNNSASDVAPAHLRVIRRPIGGGPSLRSTRHGLAYATDTAAPAVTPNGNMTSLVSSRSNGENLPYRQRPTVNTASRSDHVDSALMPGIEDDEGPYAPRPCHSSPSEATFPVSKSAGHDTGSVQRFLARRPILSMASTTFPTSPTEGGETLLPDKPGLYNPRARVPSATHQPAPSDSKLEASVEDPRDPEDQPPAYQPDVSSKATSPLPARDQSPSHVDINQIDDSGAPYIVKAAKENMAAVAQVLIERSVDLEAVDSRTGRTAIMEAARLGREEIAIMLMNAGCRLIATDHSGDTVLHHAVNGGSQRIVKQILNSNKIGIDTRGQGNRTPLHCAAEAMDTQMATLLVRSHSDPNLKDGLQRTPLHISAARGNVEMCEMLLDEGAQLDPHDADGKTPLQLAAETDRAHAAYALLHRSETSKPNNPELLQSFYEAVKIGNVRMAQSFLDKGVKLKKIKVPWKPAAFAAQSGNLDMLRLMIDNKCNLKEKNPDGWTCLHVAASLGHAGMVQRLLEQKVSWKATTKGKQETALHLAIANGHAAAAETLIIHRDANVQVTDADNQEPLHHAIRNGMTSVAQALLAVGAKPNNENKYGWKPIHLAAAYGHVTLAADLIARGVHVGEKLGYPAFKPSKQTHEAVRRGYWAEARWPHPASRPLHIALEFGQDSVAHMLLTHGAKVDGADKEGWRPLHQAAFSCNPALVEALLQRGANPHATSNDNNTPLALGFRTVGLHVTNAQKEQVRGLLQDAMPVSKPLKLDMLRRSVSFFGSSAAQRNQAWNTAEMAALLLKRHDTGSSALGEVDGALDPGQEERATGLENLSGSGITSSSHMTKESEDLSLNSSTTDLNHDMPISQANSKGRSPGPPQTPPASSLQRHQQWQQPSSPAAVEMSTHRSLHQGFAELGGAEIVELGTMNSSTTELGTTITRRMATPPTETQTAELPAEMPGGMF